MFITDHHLYDTEFSDKVLNVLFIFLFFHEMVTTNHDGIKKIAYESDFPMVSVRQSAAKNGRFRRIHQNMKRFSLIISPLCAN